MPGTRVAGRRGRLPVKSSAERLVIGYLSSYLRTPLPAPVYPIDVSAGITDWGMLGNGPDPAATAHPNGLGDATFAGLQHYRMTKAASAGELGPQETSNELLADYLAYTKGQDTGVSIAELLLFWHRIGRIVAFAPVDHTIPAEMDAALAAFHGVYVGVNLTRDADALFERNEPWTTSNGQQPDPHDSHCMLKIAADSADFDQWVTWGAVQRSTKEWTRACVEEAWVIITEEDAATTHVDLPALMADIMALHAARLTGARGNRLAPPAPPRVVDEDVRFTVYRPQVLPPGQWASLLVFAHKTDPVVVEPGRAPVDPTELVEARARAHFGGATARPTSEDARYGLPRGAQLRITPDLPGIRCNPAAAELEWWEPVHEVLFRLLAGPELAGATVRGAVRIWCGPLILGEVSVAIHVAAEGPAAEPPPIAESAQRYRKIFPSYSHQDRAVVASFADAARALGDQYLQDVLTLRAGERWEPRLLQLIEDADVFQLFWSSNSMRSQHVQDEWKHALALGRPMFIRPVYWEDPLPEDPGQQLPPAALRELHFVKVPVAKPPPPPRQPPVTVQYDGPSSSAAVSHYGPPPVTLGSPPYQPPESVRPRWHRRLAPLVIAAGIVLVLLAAIVFAIAGR